MAQAHKNEDRAMEIEVVFPEIIQLLLLNLNFMKSHSISMSIKFLIFQ